jgi:glycerophosphoryl diester phosphodiesterase
MKNSCSRRNAGVGAMLLGAAALAFLPPSMASAQTGPAPAGPKHFLTLDGKPPLVIGHRGVPGLMPEETEASYELAAALGTDSLEEDLHLTKDCVLVARHNPWLSDNTNIAEVAKTNAAVAARKRTAPGVLVKAPATTGGGPAEYPTDLIDPADPKSVLKALIVDGEDHTNDWSITDFTMAELKNWIAGTTYDAANERPKVFNGKFPILSFQDIIDIAKAKSKETGVRSPSIRKPRIRPGIMPRLSPMAAAHPAATRSRMP